MNRMRWILVLAVAIPTLVVLRFVSVNQSGMGIAIEIASAERRAVFTDILEAREVSYTVHVDHLDRVLVIPDQRKLEEYQLALEEYETTLEL